MITLLNTIYCYKYSFSYEWYVLWDSISVPAFALCHGQRGSILCGEGTKIKILSVIYGRTDGDICPGGNTAARTCRSKTALNRVKWNCNGYRICHLHASDKIFGNPCVKVSKYLKVKYRCVKKSDGNLKGWSLFYVYIWKWIEGSRQLTTDITHQWKHFFRKIIFCLFTGKQIVAFSAYTSKHLTLHRNTPVNVVYDAVYYNYGNAYNTHSGFFTAPSGGLYIFTWTSLVYPRKIFDAEILLNGQRRGLGNCDNELNPGYENCANTTPLILKTGDKVNIRTTVANYLRRHWSSFKGWKVQ